MHKYKIVIFLIIALSISNKNIFAQVIVSDSIKSHNDRIIELAKKIYLQEEHIDLKKNIENVKLCGTPDLLELNQLLSSSLTRDSTREVVNNYFENSILSLDKVFNSPDGDFKIQYNDTEGDIDCVLNPTDVDPTLTNSDGEPVPIYIINLYDALKISLQLYKNYGLRTPLSIGAINVYVKNLNAHILGSSSYAFLNIDNDLNLDELKTTSAHELFHKVQYSYLPNAFVQNWILEGTAVWAEDAVFDNDNSYVSFVNVFSHLLDLNDTQFDYTPYSTVLFWKWCSEQYGTPSTGGERGINFIKNVLENLLFRTNIGAISEAIKTNTNNEKDFNSAFSDFAIALYNISSNGDKVYGSTDYSFEEGKNYMPYIYEEVNKQLNRDNFSYNVSGAEVKRYSTRFYKFNVDENQKITIEFSGEKNGLSWEDDFAVSFFCRDAKSNLVKVKKGSLSWSNVLNKSIVTFEESVVDYSQLVVLIQGLDDGGKYNLDVTMQVEQNAPTISITSPLNNTEVSGSIAIKATATDSESGIEKVEFQVNNSKIGEDNTEPYSYTWNTSSYPSGEYEIKAIATDNSGNTNSDQIKVTIPVISITNNHDYTITGIYIEPSNPLASTTVKVKGTLQNVGKNTESSGKQVKFFVDGSEKNSTTTIPELKSGDSWPISFNWMAEKGIHNLRLQCYLPGDEESSNDFDELGVNIGVAGNLLVEGSSAPTVNITQDPGSSSTYSALVQNNGSATAGVSVSKYGNQSSWVSLTGGSSFSLDAGKSLNYEYKILVPSGTAVGDYNAGIKFSYDSGSKEVALALLIKVISMEGGLYSVVVDNSSISIDGSWASTRSLGFPNAPSPGSQFYLDNNNNTSYETSQTGTFTITTDEYTRLNRAEWDIKAYEKLGDADLRLSFSESKKYKEYSRDKDVTLDVQTWVVKGTNTFKISLDNFFNGRADAKWWVYNTRIFLGYSKAAWGKDFSISSTTVDKMQASWDEGKLYFNISSVSTSGDLILYNNGKKVDAEEVRSSDVGKTLSFSLAPNELESSNNFSIIGDADDKTKATITGIKLEVKYFSGTPILECTKTITPSEININSTATVQMLFKNIGSNIANEPTYNDSPLPDGLSLVSGRLNDNANDLDPDETDTETYTIKATDVGNYTFGATNVVYENSGSNYSSTFNAITMKVLGGDLLVVGEIDTNHIKSGKTINILANVKGSVLNNNIDDAFVVATITKPDASTKNVLLTYNTTVNKYTGVFSNTNLEGEYSVSISAEKEFYNRGNLAQAISFNVGSIYEKTKIIDYYATVTSPTSCDLHAEFDLLGFPSNIKFIYGVENQSEIESPVFLLSPSSDSINSKLLNISNLNPSTAYFFYVTAQNNGGTVISDKKYFETPAGIKVHLTKESGWNLVSIPVILPDMSVKTLYPQATSRAYSFKNGYSIADTLKVGQANWLKFEDPYVDSLIGISVNQKDIKIESGWNLVSFFEKTRSINSIQTEPKDILMTLPYSFSNFSGYSFADSIRPTQGYWVLSKEDGTITLSEGTLAKNNYTPVLDVINNCSNIKISDRNGMEKLLYVADKTVDQNMFQLPPIPPKGIFDVRYLNNSNMSQLNSEEEIVINSASYPIKISPMGTDLELSLEENGESRSSIIMSGESSSIDNKITKIAVKKYLPPSNYSLEQNYPNPFNPSTTISYSLPKAGAVKLIVYDILGREVANLVNKEQNVGNYKVQFDASTLTSGIYFYRLQSGGFVETKKLVLLR